MVCSGGHASRGGKMMSRVRPVGWPRSNSLYREEAADVWWMHRQAEQNGRRYLAVHGPSPGPGLGSGSEF